MWNCLRYFSSSQTSEMRKVCTDRNIQTSVPFLQPCKQLWWQQYSVTEVYFQRHQTLWTHEALSSRSTDIWLVGSCVNTMRQSRLHDRDVCHFVIDTKGRHYVHWYVMWYGVSVHWRGGLKSDECVEFCWCSSRRQKQILQSINILKASFLTKF